MKRTKPHFILKTVVPRAKTPLQKAVAKAKRERWEEMFLFQLNTSPVLNALRVAIYPEVELIPGRKFRFDFVIEPLQVVVEVEGGTFSGGRHTRGPGFEMDACKYAEAMILGYRILRVTTQMVKDGRALAFTERLCTVVQERRFLPFSSVAP